jgi:hypothetical protein
MDRSLAGVADGWPTVIVAGNRKRVITPRIAWKIVQGSLAAIPGCAIGLLQRFQLEMPVNTFTFASR